MRPPYPAVIATKPYLARHMIPNFQKSDGRKGNTKEHMARFIESMGPFTYNDELRLREFSVTN